MPGAVHAGRFFQFVKTVAETSDVVFIGLSLHHLPADDKRAFLPELRRIVSSEGRLIIYEPIRHPNESRDEVLARWWRDVEATWRRRGPEELAKVKEHVFGNDYPEPIDDYIEMIKAGGFSSATVLYTDPQRLYAVIEADA